MWIVELNIAGHRLTRQLPGRRRAPLRTRSVRWRIPQLRPKHAA